MLTAAEQTALVNAFTIDAATHSSTDGSGTIGWHYNIADSDLDFLGDNDVVTLTYTVQTDDGNGGTASQDVVITVHGTEDAPVITSAAQTGSVSEDGGTVGAAESAGSEHTSGTITFTDVDLSDIETSSITNTQVAATLANGYTLTAAEQTALVNAFTIDAASHLLDRPAAARSAGTTTSPTAPRLPGRQRRRDADLYGADRRRQWRHHQTQDVVITVHGTEDAPVITSRRRPARSANSPAPSARPPPTRRAVR